MGSIDKTSINVFILHVDDDRKFLFIYICNNELIYTIQKNVYRFRNTLKFALFV